MPEQVETLPMEIIIDAMNRGESGTSTHPFALMLQKQLSACTPQQTDSDKHIPLNFLIEPISHLPKMPLAPTDMITIWSSFAHHSPANMESHQFGRLLFLGYITQDLPPKSRASFIETFDSHDHLDNNKRQKLKQSIQHDLSPEVVESIIEKMGVFEASQNTLRQFSRNLFIAERDGVQITEQQSETKHFFDDVILDGQQNKGRLSPFIRMLFKE